MYTHKTPLKSYLPIRSRTLYKGIIGGETDHYTYENNEWWQLYRDDKSIAHEYVGEYSTDLYSKEARTIIANHNADKPMFMYLAFQAAHVPLQAPDSYIDMYSHITDPDRRVYAAMVTCMDDAIGSVVEQLKQSGLWNNTVLVVSTDNGGPHASGNNWPLKGAKATLWEGGVRGVGFVTSPLLDYRVRGSSNHQLIHVTDWLPTFVSLAGGDSNEIKSMDLYGVDQWNTISKNQPSMRDDVLINLVPESLMNKAKTKDRWTENEYFDVGIKAAVRVGDWKLLTGHQGPAIWFAAPESDHDTVYESDNRIVRLYNLAEDPTESNNLADSRTDKVLQCLKKLGEYLPTVLPVLNEPSINQDEAELLMPNHILAPWDLAAYKKIALLKLG
ncbi:arylsulfatase B-like [Saccoglossus kowalevskii]|uniref:Arylsulfatase B-like n=1 Tax=Saccoglossus kowalevskii TaxID=10224 RepID=A0ABM0M6T8_SACKO|nr:PREDICTED: arylsulfatase B-like [Saccoglossus kowalevskii]XP_006815729.1 PREDICTED: arylsulfatase B-like [Saccoglossus kowalevskii]